MDSPILLLPGAVPIEVIAALRRAAVDCFPAGEPRVSLAISMLADFPSALPIAGLNRFVEDALGASSWCNPDQSWLRRKTPGAHAQGWHQDGGLWVQYPLAPGPVPPMTPLVTCWIPLDPCDGERPGLEFVRQPLDGLLHFTELDDAGLRRRFAPEDFWAPRMDVGDAVVFRNCVLHRTHVTGEMRKERMSVEYRFFPAAH